LGFDINWGYHFRFGLVFTYKITTLIFLKKPKPIPTDRFQLFNKKNKKKTVLFFGLFLSFLMSFSDGLVIDVNIV